MTRSFLFGLLIFATGGLLGFVFSPGSGPTVAQDSNPEFAALARQLDQLQGEIQAWETRRQDRTPVHVAPNKRDSMDRAPWEDLLEEIKAARTLLEGLPQTDTSLAASFTLNQINRLHQGAANNQEVRYFAELGIQDEDALRNQLLFWNPEEVFKRFGRPDGIYPRDRGIQNWYYAVPREDGTTVTLLLRLHDGIVFDVYGELSTPAQ